MQIILINPELEKFIDDEVKAGHYPSPEAAIQAAVYLLRDQQAYDLDDETIAEINRAQAQFDRGEGIDFDEFAAEMRKKLVTPQ